MVRDLQPANRGAGLVAFAARLGRAPEDRWVTLGEGSTPFVALPRLGRHLGVPRLHAKLESLNPTGSYKDRIAALSMTLALERGHRGWIATSSGNAGAALAAYGARAGLPGLLVVNPSIPREKLVPLRALGAEVVAVEGLGHAASANVERAVFAAVQKLAARHHWFLGVTAHAYNPDGMRGADTIGYELAEAADIDCVYVPTGGGGLSVAVGRGLADAGSGAAVVVAQPAGCGPIARTLLGELERPVVDGCRSGISGLQLPDPPDGEASVATARCTGGWGVTAPDEAIIEAQSQLATTEGVFVEPASAAAIAGIAADRRTGRLEGHETVVALLTGSGLKDLRTSEAQQHGSIRTASPEDLAPIAAEWARSLT